MKSKIVVLVFLLLLCSRSLYGKDGGTPVYRFVFIPDSVPTAQSDFGVPPSGLFDGRKGTAALYSFFIPGSGQTMLGSPYKGFTFTFLAFGSALTSLISHNNFVASNERLDALEFQYKNSTTWQVSNSLYSSMNSVYSKLNNYKRTRNTFAVISAVVWTLNIADVVLNTNDEGETVFSSVTIDQSSVLMAGGAIDHQQRILLSVPLE
ncbi:MAG: DUF5683 domain-containing protein [Bacteroidetes bacterium]|nr:DUF5683 domain-containing protein [Bacteroidota bacterium]